MKVQSIRKFTVGLAAVFASVSISSATLTSAWDNASAGIYSAGVNGWDNGDNGGFGFGPWTLDGGGGGFFLANSTGNNVGDPASNGGNDINTTVGPLGEASGTRAWGLFNNNIGSGVTQAFRSLTNNAHNPFGLGLSHTFSFDLDNGNVINGQSVGLSLRNGSGENLWEVFFTGGGAEYIFNDSTGIHTTGIGFSRAGIHVDFTLTSPTTYSAKIIRYETTSVSGATNTLTGSLMSPGGGQAVIQARVFSAQGVGGGDNDFFANSFLITVPEPTIMGLSLVGLLLVAFRRR